MRKEHKQDVLDFIESLHQANEEIRIALDQKNLKLVQNMICECQEFAISLGENIEKTEGEGHVTVSCIEDYCENLFYMFEDIKAGNVNENKIYKTLRKQLIKIENSAKNDIHVRKEVAFFPYKASMWDSLESVYFAAKEDSECDAYCVPIPYYELNVDHSFGKVHYEGREYPKNIEIVDWESYRFEERKPDEIYIHNPYDSWNLLTSVHPRFYANNLKKYTDKLIYIPYFILGETEPDDQDAVAGMRHFVQTPGVIYADKVIVQSEKMKQIYVSEYLKFAMENGLEGKHLDREYQEKRILGLGSPKVDKVQNTKKKDIEIPAKWLKVIQKSDGSWKKIVFYNTGITALLGDNENWVEKIEDTLRIFKENQSEIALLWRPHPLIENTMKSMRPWIMQRYLESKSQYLHEGWGIFDNTSDVERAVILSDVYYGDGSSVVQLFQQIGKPVLLQNARVIRKRNKESALF